ncbi:MAG: hypothetical protein CMJ17_01255 [Phenylobacterium sp.]|nr:hypothetical protein [Phenylobacterium sp.]
MKFSALIVFGLLDRFINAFLCSTSSTFDFVFFVINLISLKFFLNLIFGNRVNFFVFFFA